MADLTMTRGDARTLDVPITLDGAPWTIPVGATVRFTAKERTTDADGAAKIAKSTGSGITAVDDVATVTIAPADTDALAADGLDATLWYDVQVAGAGFGPWTVARGRLIVQPDVTRATP